ncbi:MAG: metallophosphoesterase [Clostridia bacterium]|nr:metallophosphoesterase [Clostridia bacterium]
MIYVTGDTHGQIDFYKLWKFAKDHPELTKKDYVIIAGDFGAIWEEDLVKFDLKPYMALPFTVLFVDGNHENFDVLIHKYPVEEWMGGKVHKVANGVIHLMRGQVFEIEGKRIFTMGGGTSIDKAYRTGGFSWWCQEMITYDDQIEGDKNLARYGNEVDYVITHSCDVDALYALDLSERMYKKYVFLDNIFLSTFARKIKYKRWFFGHYHVEQELPNNKIALYNSIIPLE